MDEVGLCPLSECVEDGCLDWTGLAGLLVGLLVVWGFVLEGAGYPDILPSIDVELPAVWGVVLEGGVTSVGGTPAEGWITCRLGCRPRG